MNDLGLGIVVSMRDAFSRNAQRVQSSMSALDQTVAAASANMQRNLDRIQKGTMMIGAGLSMLALPTLLVASTAATQKALGELASLGVKDLKALELAAQDFTNQWAGSSKAEFLTAAYDVRSALSGLTDEAVGKFSQMAVLTGKATKATTEEMVGTFTTAYGIFKPIMSDLSDIEWAEQFAGAMAQTVASFKTNGAQMAEAIKNIGAVAAASNVPLEEQLAILGQLQTTMPGSEAGTLYKAFIMKAAEAGDELGLEFVDSTGQLKSVLEILDAVKEKFPDLSQAAAQVEIKKAFGSDEAVKFLLQMSQGLETLEGNIESISRAMRTGTAVTLEMARAMNADIGARFTLLRQQVQNLLEILGATLLPVVTPLMEELSKFVLRLQSIAQNAPNVTRALLTLLIALGGIAVAAGAVTALVGTLGIMIPAIKAGFLALSAGAGGAAAAVGAWFFPVVAAIAVVVGGVYLLKRAWESNFAGIQDIVLGAWSRVKAVFEGIRQLVSSLRNGTGNLSADVAEQLQSMGLLGFVTTVFRITFRIREFLVNLWTAFKGSFGAIREILEPAVTSLFDAYRQLADALGFVFRSLTAGDRVGAVDFWQALGVAVGETLGFLAKVAAVIIAYAIQPTIRMVRVLAVAIRVGYQVGEALVGAFVSASRFVLKFFLPLRLLIQVIRHAYVAVSTLWGVFRGDISVLAGLKRIGGSVLKVFAEPFLWARDAIVGAFRGLRALPGMLVRLASLAGRGVLRVFLNLPLIRLFRAMLGRVTALFSGGGLVEAGGRLVRSLGAGILSMAAWPLRAMRGLLTRILSPFGTAQSQVEHAGGGLVQGFVSGILRFVSWPARVFLRGVSTLLSSVSGFTGGFIGVGRKIVEAFAAPVRGLSNIATGVLGRVSAPFQVFGTYLTSLWNRLAAGPSVFVSGLLAIFAGILDPIIAPFQNLAAFFAGLWEMLSEGVGGFVNGILSRFSLVLEGLKGIAEIGGKVFNWLFGKDKAEVNIGAAMEQAANPAPVLPVATKSEQAAAVAPALPAIPVEASTAGAGVQTGPVPMEAAVIAQSSPVPHVAASPSDYVAEERGFVRFLAKLNTLVEAAINRIQAIGTPMARAAAPSALAVSLMTPASVPAVTMPAVERPSLSISLPRMEAPDLQLPQPSIQPLHEWPLGSINPSPRLVLPEIPEALRSPASVVSATPTFMPPVPYVPPSSGQEFTGQFDLPAPRIDLPTILDRILGDFDVAEEIGDRSSANDPVEPIIRERNILGPGQAALLGETRGTNNPGQTSPGNSSGGSDEITRLLQSLVTELRSASDRPINLTVNTNLEGRQIAQAVYKDLRERKIRNYETL